MAEKKIAVVGETSTITPELLAALKAELKAEIQAEVNADIESKRIETEKASEERAAKGEKLLEQFEKSTLSRLKAEKQVPILIPLSEIGDNSPIPIGINGVVYTIPKGKEFMVPESIKKQWYESYTKTIAANARLVVKQMDAEIEIRD